MPQTLSLLTSPAFISLALVFASILWMLRDEKDKTRVLLFFGLLLNVVYGFALNAFMGAEDAMFPLKYDYFLYHLDTALGASAPAIARSVPLGLTLYLRVIYNLMIPMMLVLYLFAVALHRRQEVAIAYVAELVVGPMLYALLPVCGPLYAFRAAWLDPPTHVPLSLVKLSAMPNAFPSLHFATAFVTLMFARTGVWKACYALFFLSTVLATIVTGEHYLIDLVGGFLFGSFAYALGTRRYLASLTCLAAIALFELDIRLRCDFLVAHPTLLRCVIVILLLIPTSIWTARRLMLQRPNCQPTVCGIREGA